jgi:hypothetical protein
MSERYYRTKINRLQYTIARIENIITKDILDEYKVYQIKIILNEDKLKISQIDEHASDEDYFK